MLNCSKFRFNLFSFFVLGRELMLNSIFFGGKKSKENTIHTTKCFKSNNLEENFFLRILNEIAFGIPVLIYISHYTCTEKWDNVSTNRILIGYWTQFSRRFSNIVCIESARQCRQSFSSFSFRLLSCCYWRCIIIVVVFARMVVAVAAAAAAVVMATAYQRTLLLLLNSLPHVAHQTVHIIGSKQVSECVRLCDITVKDRRLLSLRMWPCLDECMLVLSCLVWFGSVYVHTCCF